MAIRAAYTKDEEDELALFLAMNPGPRNGKTLYQEFALTHPSHSWQSWRGHYLSATLKMDAVIRRTQRELKSKKANPVGCDKSKHRSRSSSQEIELMNIEDFKKKKGKGKAPPLEVIEIDCDSGDLQTSSRTISAANGRQEFVLQKISNDIQSGIKQPYNLMDQPVLTCPREFQLNPQVPLITLSSEEKQSFLAFISSYPEGDLRLSLKFYENYHSKVDKFSPAEYRAYYLAHLDQAQNVSSQKPTSMEPVVGNDVIEPDLPAEGQEAMQLDDGDQPISDITQKCNGLTELAEETTLEIDSLSISTGSADDLDLEYILTCHDHSELAKTMGIPNNVLESFLKLKENHFDCLTSKPSDSAGQSDLLSVKSTTHLNGLPQLLEYHQGAHEDDSTIFETHSQVNGVLPYPTIASSQHLENLPQSTVAEDDEELDENVVSAEVSDSVKQDHPPLPKNRSPRHLNNLPLSIENNQEPPHSYVLIDMPGLAQDLHLPLSENEKSIHVNDCSGTVMGEPEPNESLESIEMPDSEKDCHTLLLEDDSLKNSHKENDGLENSNKENDSLENSDQENDSLENSDQENDRLEDSDNLSEMTHEHAKKQHLHSPKGESVKQVNGQAQSTSDQSGPNEDRVRILKRKFSDRGLESNSKCSSDQDKETLTAFESSLPPSETISRHNSFRPVGAPNSVDEAIELLSIFLADFSELYTPPEAVKLFRQCGDWALMFEVATLQKAEKEMKEALNEMDNGLLSKDQANDKELVDQNYALRIQSMLWSPEEDEIILQASSSSYDVNLHEYQDKLHLLTLKRGAQAIKNRREFLMSIHQ